MTLEKEQFRCQQCCSVFSRAYHLKVHKMEHNGKERLKCNLCPYSSMNSNSLKEHIRTHSGEKPYQCKVCDFKSSGKGYLKRHTQNHLGGRYFQCELYIPYFKSFFISPKLWCCQLNCPPEPLAIWVPSIYCRHISRSCTF